MTKTWLEATLNGPWQRKIQPNFPIAVGEMIPDGPCRLVAGEVGGGFPHAALAAHSRSLLIS
jgi:hypothetical protein